MLEKLDPFEPVFLQLIVNRKLRYIRGEAKDVDNKWGHAVYIGNEIQSDDDILDGEFYYEVFNIAYKYKNGIEYILDNRLGLIC